MQTLPCHCTAVFCGHASGERCPRPAQIILRIAVATLDTRFAPPINIPICQACWTNFQSHLPGFAVPAEAWPEVG